MVAGVETALFSPKTGAARARDGFRHARSDARPATALTSRPRAAGGGEVADGLRPYPSAPINLPTPYLTSHPPPPVAFLCTGTDMVDEGFPRHVIC